MDDGLLYFSVINYIAKWNIFACLLKEEIPLNDKALYLLFESIELMFAYSSQLLQYREV